MKNDSRGHAVHAWFLRRYRLATARQHHHSAVCCAVVLHDLTPTRLGFNEKGEDRYDVSLYARCTLKSAPVRIPAKI